MTDNITALANTGSGTDVFATDDIGGVNYPRTKLTVGADGVNDGDVSAENPLPVEDQRAHLILARLIDNVGVLSPDAAGRLRMTLETQTVTVSGSLTSAGSVTTVTTVTNMAQAGGHPLNQLMPTLMIGNEGDLRRNIVIS